MSIRRITSVLLCTALIFTAGIQSYGLTAYQKEVQNAGVSVNWLDFGISNEAVFIYGEPEEGGLLLVRMVIDDEQGIDKYGFINTSGQVIIPFEYDDAQTFRDGLAHVRKGNQSYFMDVSQNVVIDTSAYSHAEEIYKGQIRVYIDGQGYGMIDTQGNVIMACQYGQISTFSDGMMYASNTSGKFALFNKAGTPITEFLYDDFYGDSDGLYCIQSNGKFGFIDGTGTVVIPAIYDEAHTFSEGLASVSLNGKYGYIDKQGNTVIPMAYSYAGSFYEDGTAYVWLNDEEGFYINKEGTRMESSDSSEIYYDDDGYGYTTEIVKDFYSRGTVENEYGGISFGTDTYSMKEGIYTHSVIDKSGKTIIGPKEYYLDYAGEGIFVGTHNDFEGTGIAPPHNDSLMRALVGSDGNRYTTFRNYYFSDFENGLSVVGRPRPTYHKGIVNQYGAVIIPTMFSNLYLGDNGQCLVEVSGYDENGPYGSIGTLQLPADASTRANSEPKVIPVYLNGIELYFDQEPEIIQERTMVPMRKIFEVLGAVVEWDEATDTVTAVRDDVTVKLPIGSSTAIINGESVMLDAPAVVQAGSTLVPLRMVAEALGADVKWDNSRFCVVITIDQ